MSKRYVVTEIEGFYSPGTHSNARNPGLSVQVVDTAVCHRVMGTFRTEDHRYGGRTRAVVREHVRRLAAEACDRLNAEDEGRLAA
jgi:hypothetical protein